MTSEGSHGHQTEHVKEKHRDTYETTEKHEFGTTHTHTQTRQGTWAKVAHSNFLFFSSSTVVFLAAASAFTSSKKPTGTATGAEGP